MKAACVIKLNKALGDSPLCEIYHHCGGRLSFGKEAMVKIEGSMCYQTKQSLGRFTYELNVLSLCQHATLRQGGHGED